jgi:arylsulfatase A-like enzyme
MGAHGTFARGERLAGTRMLHATAALVLLIVADDLGVETLASIPTPQLDGLAARGVRFTQGWANPLCTPTRAALLTGRHGFRTGVGGNNRGRRNELPLDELALPELFDEPSHAFGKWHLSQNPIHPNLSGFARFAGSRRNVKDHYDWPLDVDGLISNTRDYTTAFTVDDVLRHPAPFLYVALHAPHAPLQAPPGTDAATLSAVVRPMDAEIGRLVAGFPDAIVIFTSDNGTAAPLGGGQGTLLESGIHVPLTITGPGIAPGVCHGLVHLVDVFATVAELRGVASTAEDSRNLVPYLADPGRASLRRFDYAGRFRREGGAYVRREQAVRDERWKLIRTLDGERVFDLALDPGERFNLLPRGPAHAALAEALDALAR